jgi:hypothetical protein
MRLILPIVILAAISLGGLSAPDPSAPFPTPKAAPPAFRGYVCAALVR